MKTPVVRSGKGSFRLDIRQYTPGGRKTHKKCETSGRIFSVDGEDLFGVDRPTDRTAEEAFFWSDMWCISHIPTGRSVFRVSTLRKARPAVLALLGTGIDWTNNRVAYYKGLPKATRAKVKKVKEAIGG